MNVYVNNVLDASCNSRTRSLTPRFLGPVELLTMNGAGLSDPDARGVWGHLCRALLLASGGLRRSLMCGWLCPPHLPSVHVLLCVLMSPFYKDIRMRTHLDDLIFTWALQRPCPTVRKVTFPGTGAQGLNIFWGHSSSHHTPEPDIF